MCREPGPLRGGLVARSPGSSPARREACRPGRSRSRCLQHPRRSERPQSAVGHRAQGPTGRQAVHDLRREGPAVGSRLPSRCVFARVHRPCRLGRGTPPPLRRADADEGVADSYLPEGHSLHTACSAPAAAAAGPPGSFAVAQVARQLGDRHGSGGPTSERGSWSLLVRKAHILATLHNRGENGGPVE